MKKVIIAIVVIVVVVAIGYLLVSRLNPGTTAETATPAASGQQLPPVRASNEVVSDAVVVPIQYAGLSLPAGGIVAEIPIAEGDTVAAGDMLLKLESARQAAAVAQAQAGLLRAQNALAEIQAGARPEEIAAAQAAVDAAQSQLTRLEEGARPEEIAAAQAAVDAAQAQFARLEEGARPEEIQAAEAALDGARASLQKVQEGPGEEELVAARADLANAEAAVAQAQAAYDPVKYDPQIQARPESLQLEQATNAYEAAKARLAAIQNRATAADVAAARSGIDQAQAQLEALKAPARAADMDSALAGINQAQAQLEALLAPARAADVAAAQAEIRRAQAQLELLKSGARPETIAGVQADVAAAEAALAQAQIALDDTELYAPFPGKIASLDAKVGEQVSPGMPIVTLADLSGWQIETDDLTELNIVRVNEGDPVLITFDAVPDLELPGKVIRIKEIGENKMGDITYTVIIMPDEYDDRLRWNMTATVVIEPE
jgi:HlyD family secretion protein